MSRHTLAVAAALLSWVLLCVRWFDAGAPFRPSWLAAVPPVLLLAALAGAALVLHRDARPAGTPDPALYLAVGFAVFFRLPFVTQGAAGAVTPDGALSGIVALHVRDAVEHLVFVPHVPYSGSLKSHLAAPLAAVVDPARAFALASVLFYAAFVAGVVRLASLVAGVTGWSVRAAGLYAAFAPAFVTRYSVSNDGNYVEVLALGTWAAVLAARWARAPETGPPALAIGLLLGLAGWCHILALVPLASVGIALLLVDARRALRAAPALALGLVAGYFPALVWNAGNGWASFRYLLPGGGVGAIDEGPGVGGRLAGMVAGQWPVLLGFDPGYGDAADRVLLALAWCAVAAALFAVGWCARAAVRGTDPVLRALVGWVLVNVAIAAAALPLVPGNPRYLLFLMTPLPILLAHALAGRGRAVMAALVAFSALTSLGQLPGTARADRQWRAFVGALETEGVRHCFTDFFLATKVNFLSEERVVCSAKLGPTTTEYFFEYRRAVDEAPSAALVAVNGAAADKLERRLQRLGVTYERRELMKP
ncbi:MAG: hypothetical protein ABW221_00975, partial [Vicinamibacteria bacterium]